MIAPIAEPISAGSWTMNDPDEGVRRGYHLLEPNQMADAIRAIVAMRPAVAFADLREGAWYLFGKRHQVIYVTRRTASGRQVVARLPQAGAAGLDPSTPEARLYAGDYQGLFAELDDGLVRLLGVTHEAVVRAAIATHGALAVAPVARRHHPHLYVDASRWDRPAVGDVDAQAGVDRVRNALLQRSRVSRASGAYVGPDDVILWMRETAGRHARMLAAAVEPASIEARASWDRMILNAHELIQYYDWLLPLVRAGGVFHLPTAATTADAAEEK